MVVKCSYCVLLSLHCTHWLQQNYKRKNHVKVCVIITGENKIPTDALIVFYTWMCVLCRCCCWFKILSMKLFLWVKDKAKWPHFLFTSLELPRLHEAQQGSDAAESLSLPPWCVYECRGEAMRWRQAWRWPPGEDCHPQKPWSLWGAVVTWRPHHLSVGRGGLFRLFCRKVCNSSSPRGGEGRGWAVGHSRPCQVGLCARALPLPSLCLDCVSWRPALHLTSPLGITT